MYIFVIEKSEKPVEEEDTSSDELKKPFSNKFRIQFRKYWRYTKKWFPFAIIIGILSGVLMGLFTSLVVNLQKWTVGSIPIYIRYPLVGAVTSLFLYFGFKEVRGAGISYVLKHKNTTTAIPKKALLTKFFASVLTLGVNAPAGREGPAVTLGSTAAFTIADMTNMSNEDEMHAVTIGAAACTSAVFGAPLGGTVFAAEVPFKHDLDETVFLPALLASAIAFLVSDAILRLLNSKPVFLDVEQNIVVQLKFVDSMIYILLGIIAGLSGIGFSLLFKNLSKWTGKYIKSYYLPLVGMLLTTIIVIVIELYLPPTADRFSNYLPPHLSITSSESLSLGGTGFQAINVLLENYQTVGLGVLFLLFVGKMLATSTCVGFGASGGVMGPSLVTGAALGVLYWKLFSFMDINPIALIIISMSAFHTATTKTPIASMILVLEMVGFPRLIIPIILSNAAAFIVSMDFSLYTGQVQSKEVLLRRRIKYTDILETLNVSEAMGTDYVTVKENDSLQETFTLLYLHKTSYLLVVDDRGGLTGIISATDFQRGFSKGSTLVSDSMSRNLIIAYPDETLREAFDKLTTNRIECLPVVNQDETSKILGIVSYSDIETRYEAEVTKLQLKRKLTIEELENDL